MKILVFVKQVPKTDDVRLDPITGNLQRDGVESMMNPLDMNAVEAAVRLKEENGGEVVAISMGPPQALACLKTALSLGCDRAVLLSDRAFGGADTLATGYVLAKATEKIGNYDLLIFGRHAVDAETAQTGPVVAAALGLPQLTYVSDIRCEGGSVVCERRYYKYTEIAEADMPAVITVNADVNTPRYAHVRDILHVNDKPVEIYDCAGLGCDPECTGVKGSPSINKTLFTPEKQEKATVKLCGDPEEIAERLIAAFSERHLI